VRRVLLDAALDLACRSVLVAVPVVMCGWARGWNASSNQTQTQYSTWLQLQP
jgi:hypothetical protein